MFGDGIKYICRLGWRFIIGVSDRQQAPLSLTFANPLYFFLPTTKAYVEFIGREKARAYLQCTYCKVKQWI
jgi:hypothetical protein